MIIYNLKPIRKVRFIENFTLLHIYMYSRWNSMWLQLLQSTSVHIEHKEDEILPLLIPLALCVNECKLDKATWDCNRQKSVSGGDT